MASLIFKYFSRLQVFLKDEISSYECDLNEKMYPTLLCNTDARRVNLHCGNTVNQHTLIMKTCP